MRSGRLPAVTGWRLLLALLVLGTCWLAFSPAPPPRIDTGWDKANHGLAFSTMAITAWLSFPRARRRNVGVALWLVGFGIFIELVQSHIPERSAEALDVLADAAGIALGLLLVQTALRLRRR